MNLDNMKRLIPMRIIVDEIWKDGKSLLADSGRGPSTLTSDIAIAESDDIHNHILPTLVKLICTFE